ncbi:hypothetical protein SAMN05192529_11459 [Arachidicoccus rhizosphaerae]|uniref:Uncharacterized protein n=1 Tax=Arachidicoccus rhizosphaerae TaxID=551991 RepID=A0A1H4AEB4_9BACT|nr:hypothetical protein SAMN05192529_11459 [Arachidicoccus rhizosphaerae]
MFGSVEEFLSLLLVFEQLSLIGKGSNNFPSDKYRHFTLPKHFLSFYFF